MISKELLSVVKGYPNDFDVFEYDEEIGMIIHVSTWASEYDEEINIHELAHKCKEWAFNKWFDINSSVDEEGYAILSSNKDEEQILNRNKYIEEFTAKTEPEAIFKACQWALDNG